jgi:hypothetical protein
VDFTSYTEALRAEPFDEIIVERILDTYYHSGAPYVFGGNADAYGLFRRSLANEISSAFGIGCHPHQLVICGSAHLGFSAAPNEKFGTPFSFSKSDVDVAVLLPELFDRWWFELVKPGIILRKRRLIANHLLNGYINPKLVRYATTSGRKWWKLFAKSNAGGLNKVRGRIYRDPQFMQTYHRLSVIKGREKLRGARA